MKAGVNLTCRQVGEGWRCAAEQSCASSEQPLRMAAKGCHGRQIGVVGWEIPCMPFALECFMLRPGPGLAALGRPRTKDPSHATQDRPPNTHVRSLQGVYTEKYSFPWPAYRDAEGNSALISTCLDRQRNVAALARPENASTRLRLRTTTKNAGTSAILKHFSGFAQVIQTSHRRRRPQSRFFLRIYTLVSASPSLRTSQHQQAKSE